VRVVGRYYDPTTGQFLTVDPAVSITGQPYSYAGDDPVNESDPTGLITCGSWVPIGCGVVTDAQHHWRGAAQVATTAGIGLVTAGCIAATDDLCALALPEIGGLTGDALYAESAGPHTAQGYATAFAEGGIGGSIALACVAVCEIAGSLVIGGAVVNGLWGAGQGIADYADNGDCQHTVSGYLSAGASGFAQGAIPWDQILKALHPGS
jgi:hypothetical protein